LPNFKLTIEYDGTRFHGWQAQDGLRTVQGVLAEACSRLAGGDEVALQGASRTDRGVHASGQVATVALDVSIPTERLADALNGGLPDDIHVRQADRASDDFNARFSAVGKHYRYLVFRGRRAGAFFSRYALPWDMAVDLVALHQASEALVGEQDFASFRCNSGREDPTVRTLSTIRAFEEGPFVCLDFWGRSFLYKMVRTLVGTLLDVARGRTRPEQIPQILAARDRSAAGATVEARGLHLVQVYYDDDLYYRSCSAAPGLLGTFGETLTAWRSAGPDPATD
jgi:tRNA pseudouridine38-40 synthase